MTSVFGEGEAGTCVLANTVVRIKNGIEVLPPGQSTRSSLLYY